MKSLNNKSLSDYKKKKLSKYSLIFSLFLALNKVRILNFHLKGSFLHKRLMIIFITFFLFYSILQHRSP